MSMMDTILTALTSNAAFQLELLALLTSLLISYRLAHALPYFFTSGVCFLFMAGVAGLASFLNMPSSPTPSSCLAHAIIILVLTPLTLVTFLAWTWYWAQERRQREKRQQWHGIRRRGLNTFHLPLDFPRLIPAPGEQRPSLMYTSRLAHLCLTIVFTLFLSTVLMEIQLWSTTDPHNLQLVPRRRFSNGLGKHHHPRPMHPRIAEPIDLNLEFPGRSLLQQHLAHTAFFAAMHLTATMLRWLEGWAARESAGRKVGEVEDGEPTKFGPVRDEKRMPLG